MTESNLHQPDAQVQQEHQVQSRNPLHGITLEHMMTELVEHFGWEVLGQRVRVRSFNNNPSIASSLKFLRKTPWARQEVDDLYLFLRREKARQKPQEPRRSAPTK